MTASKCLVIFGADEKSLAGLGQRFLRSLLPKAGQADGSLEASPRDAGSAVLSPRIMGGHLEGEGVRNIAALLADAAEQNEECERVQVSMEDHDKNLDKDGRESRYIVFS